VATDQDLIEIIERSRLPAVRSIEFEQVPQHERPNDALSMWNVAEPLKEAMNTHPEFGSPFSRFFLGKQLAFANDYQAMNILRVSVTSGAVDALAWYRRALARKRTNMRVVAEVYGLWVKRRHAFSNGVVLLPASELPDSPNSVFLKYGSYRGFGLEFPPAAVIFELDEVDEDNSETGHQRFLEISEQMRRTVTALVLSDDAAPTMAVGWQEFADPDLQRAEFGRVWTSSSHEGRLPHYPADVTDVMLDRVEQYLRLPPEVAGACDVPLARLNLARRRMAPGDKAIDGSVCLEALLSGRSRGELTHRLSVRAALLLGRSLTERQTIAEKVRKFYALRSDVVHGSTSAKESVNQKIAQDGLLVCLACLRAVVESAQLPEPELWELTGGPVWNRYAENGCLVQSSSGGMRSRE
jgi:hypothetical protein